ncbi:MAG: hypothetical protein AB7O97_23575 [Planctomycetota bacterium]
MARRDRSAASRSSSSTRRPGGAGRTPRGRSDGKVDIYCPQCGAHFRIADTALDSKVVCKDCTRTFIAKTTVGKRAKVQDHSKVYVGFGVGAVLVIGTLWMMSGGTDEPPKVVAAEPTGPSQLELDTRARRDQAMRWAGALTKKDLFTLNNYSDMPALRTQLALDADLIGDARDEAFFAALQKDDAGRLFFEMECTAADIGQDAVAAGKGTAEFYFQSKPGDTVYDPKAGARIQADWRMEGAQLKISGFRLTLKPVVRGRRPGDEDKYFKPSTEIARPELTETTRAGKTVKVRESQPVPIAHLEGTTEAQRTEIDQAVADLIYSASDDAPGNLFNRALGRIRKHDRAGVARLMNALNDLYPDVMGNNMKISQVNRALRDVSGLAWAYDHVGTGNAAADRATRESVIRQWFAWWWRYANDDYQEAIDQDEDLLDGPKKDDGGE